MFYISLVLAFFLPHPPQKCPLLDYIPFYCAPIAELASTLYIEPLFHEGIGRLSIGGEAGVRIWADEAAVLRGQLQLPERLTACAQALEEAGLPVGDLSTCQQETVLRIEIEVVEDGVGPVLAAVRVEGVQRAQILGL
jgi:hypothetical protein